MAKSRQEPCGAHDEGQASPGNKRGSFSPSDECLSQRWSGCRPSSWNGSVRPSTPLTPSRTGPRNRWRGAVISACETLRSDQTNSTSPRGKLVRGPAESTLSRGGFPLEKWKAGNAMARNTEFAVILGRIAANGPSGILRPFKPHE